MRIITNYTAAGRICKEGYAKKFSDLRCYIAASRLASDVKISHVRAYNLLNNDEGYLTREEYERVAQVLNVKVQDVLKISIKRGRQQTAKKKLSSWRPKK